MIDTIKKVVKNYLNNADLTTIQYGIVVNTNPIQLQVEKLIIPSSNLIFPSWFETIGIKVEMNDKLLVLKQQGGQLFYVLDKI